MTLASGVSSPSKSHKKLVWNEVFCEELISGSEYHMWDVCNFYQEVCVSGNILVMLSKMNKTCCANMFLKKCFLPQVSENRKEQNLQCWYMLWTCRQCTEHSFKSVCVCVWNHQSCFTSLKVTQTLNFLTFFCQHTRCCRGVTKVVCTFMQSNLTSNTVCCCMLWYCEGLHPLYQWFS